MSKMVDQLQETHIDCLRILPTRLVHWFFLPSFRPPKSTASNAHYISATKRATGAPLVSKQGIFEGFLDFWMKITNNDQNRKKMTKMTKMTTIAENDENRQK